MARYGRKGRSVTCSYEEIIDFNTTGGSISVMGIHTPDDQTPLKMFPGLFQQFKKWKYLGCKIVGANAAQLPVDPLGVGYEAGEGNESVADPRDIFDPIMFHGCHGEDLGAVLNRLYTPLHDLSDSIVAFTESEGSDSDLGRAAVLEGLYYKALTDRTWRKFPIQGGIRLRGLHPLVYSLATNHYISPNMQEAEFYDPTDGTIPGFDAPDAMSNATGVSGSNDTRFFTPRLQRLGWMDTRVPYVSAGAEIPSPADPDEGYAEWRDKLRSTTNYAMMPRIFMGVLLIPKSRRIKQYMRLRIVHYFKFAGFRGASMDLNVLGSPSFFEAESNVGDIDVPSQDDSILGGNPGEDPGGDTPSEKALIGTVTLTLKNNTGSSVYYNPVGTIVYGNLERTKGTAGTSIALAAGSSKVWTWNDGWPADGIDVGTVITGIAVVGGNAYTNTITIASGDVSRNIQIDISSAKLAYPDEVKEDGSE